LGESGLHAVNTLLSTLLRFVLAQFVDQRTEGEPAGLAQCRTLFDPFGLGAQMLDGLDNLVGWSRQIGQLVQGLGAFEGGQVLLLDLFRQLFHTIPCSACGQRIHENLLGLLSVLLLFVLLVDGVLLDLLKVLPGAHPQHLDQLLQFNGLLWFNSLLLVLGGLNQFAQCLAGLVHFWHLLEWLAFRVGILIVAVHIESFLLCLPFIGVHQRFIRAGTLGWHLLWLLFHLTELKLGRDHCVHRRAVLAILHFGIFVHILGQQFGAFQLATILALFFRFSAAF